MPPEGALHTLPLQAGDGHGTYEIRKPEGFCSYSCYVFVGIHTVLVAFTYCLLETKDPLGTFARMMGGPIWSSRICTYRSRPSVPAEACQLSVYIRKAVRDHWFGAHESMERSGALGGALGGVFFSTSNNLSTMSWCMAQCMRMRET